MGGGNQRPVLGQTLGTAFGCWLCCGCLDSPCISSQVSSLLLGWEVQSDDLAFGGVFAVRCAEKCPTGDVKSQGEMQAALEAFPSSELLFLNIVSIVLQSNRANSCNFFAV